MRAGRWPGQRLRARTVTDLAPSSGPPPGRGLPGAEPGATVLVIRRARRRGRPDIGPRSPAARRWTRPGASRSSAGPRLRCPRTGRDVRSRDGRLRGGPSPGRVVRRAVQAVNPPRRHRGDRIQIHGDHGVTGDQEAVTRSVVRDVTRGVSGHRHAIPVGQERNARFRVESQQHVVESAGPGHPGPCSVGQQRDDGCHQPPSSGWYSPAAKGSSAASRVAYLRSGPEDAAGDSFDGFGAEVEGPRDGPVGAAFCHGGQDVAFTVGQCGHRVAGATPV
jgi:hypothetical protein